MKKRNSKILYAIFCAIVIGLIGYKLMSGVLPDSEWKGLIFVGIFFLIISFLGLVEDDLRLKLGIKPTKTDKFKATVGIAIIVIILTLVVSLILDWKLAREFILNWFLLILALAAVALWPWVTRKLK